MLNARERQLRRFGGAWPAPIRESRQVNFIASDVRPRTKSPRFESSAVWQARHDSPMRENHHTGKPVVPLSTLSMIAHLPASLPLSGTLILSPSPRRQQRGINGWEGARETISAINTIMTPAPGCYYAKRFAVLCPRLCCALGPPGSLNSNHDRSSFIGPLPLSSFFSHSFVIASIATRMTGRRHVATLNSFMRTSDRVALLEWTRSNSFKDYTRQARLYAEQHGQRTRAAHLSG